MLWRIEIENLETKRKITNYFEGVYFLMECKVSDLCRMIATEDQTNMLDYNKEFISTDEVKEWEDMCFSISVSQLKTIGGR